MNVTTASSAVAEAAGHSIVHASALFHAAGHLLPHLERGRVVDARRLRDAMEQAFGGTDAEGAWSWNDAYEACEASQVLFLRKFGSAMRARAEAPTALLAMLAKLAALLPSQTRRSQESQALQQFSTPIALGYVASVAAGITSRDLVLEPSAGTGLLAIFAEHGGAALVSGRPLPPCHSGTAEKRRQKLTTEIRNRSCTQRRKRQRHPENAGPE